jgi:hypothetical protein
MPLDHIVRSLAGVKGHIVSMPLRYMEDVQLIAGGINLEVNNLTGTASFWSSSNYPDDIYT